MKRYSIVISLLLLFGCGVDSSDDKQNIEIQENEDFVLCQYRDMSRKESTTGGYFDFEMISDSTYKLRWGTSLFERFLPDTFYCDSSPVAHPALKEESEKYIVTTFGCGSPCWGSYVLPLNEEQEPTFVMYQYAFDLNRDIVVYLDAHIEEPTLVIQNLKSGKRFEHLIDPECQAAIPTFCLKDVKIEEKELILEWNYDGVSKEIQIEKINLENVLQQPMIDYDPTNPAHRQSERSALS